MPSHIDNHLQQHNTACMCVPLVGHQRNNRELYRPVFFSCTESILFTDDTDGKSILCSCSMSYNAAIADALEYSSSSYDDESIQCEWTVRIWWWLTVSTF
jgi:hypothetical protein